MGSNSAGLNGGGYAGMSGQKDISTTTALPSDDLFDIAEFACMLMGKKLSGYTSSSLVHPVLEAEKARHLTFRIAVVSICHQFNWDFLNKRLADKLLSGPTGNLVERLTSVSAPELSSWFSDYSPPERVRATERARILREVGRTLESEFGSNAINLLERSHYRLGGANGFFALMDTFEAFREDPLRKKTNVLTHEIIREGIARFDDEDRIAPAIDYHLIRLYLRTGRVVPRHSSIFRQLVDAAPRPRPRLVRLLREKVAQAVLLTAGFSRLSIPDLNYIEWHLGRTVCLHDGPNCFAKIRASKLDPDIGKLFEGACPYSECCLAFANPEWMRLQEPVFKKTFY